jgi:adenosylhomocysteinase
MRDGVVLANAGAWDLEIDLPALAADCTGRRTVRTNVEEYTLSDGRRLNVVGQGVVVNLSAGDGHPIEIMDLSFAIQALCIHHLVHHHEQMTNSVHRLPPEIDREVARIKLEAVGMGTDTLSARQEEFLTSWRY